MSNKRIIYQTRIHQLIDHTPFVRELVIDFIEPNEFQFRAGQFVMLHVPQEPGGKPALRAYSIASDDRNSKQIRLLFKHVDGGVASTFVWNLKGHETLELTGPFGRVFFVEPPGQQVVFLCTGTGLAQHLCFLESKAELFPNVRYHLYFGLQKEEDIFCESELKALAARLPHFQYSIVLSRPSSAWQGRKGYVQNFLSELEFHSLDIRFYLCGNGQMIKDSKSLLIEGHGIEATRIFSEAFD